jgi:anti-sigma regulatory factor (Ser/Thr protein kinase)
MATGTQERQLTLAADVAAGRDLRRLLTQLCDQTAIDEQSMGDFVLAVSEAFSNAVRHGVSSATDRVKATVEINATSGRVVLTYPGDPFPLDEPRLPDPASTGGRGRYLIKLLVDRVDYTFSAGVTHAELWKQWPGAAGTKATPKSKTKE